MKAYTYIAFETVLNTGFNQFDLLIKFTYVNHVNYIHTYIYNIYKL
jgi:hypothetical protein